MISRKFLNLLCPLVFAAGLGAQGKDKMITPVETSPPTHLKPKTLILDGFWGWNSRWEDFRSQIDHQVGPCQIWHYDNSGRTSIEQLGARLAEELRKPNAPRNLVGYSMGGIVIREALRQTPEFHPDKVALLHSPNYGTIVAYLLPLPALVEMRPGSTFMKRLDAAPWHIPTLATWCPGDLIVVPGSSGRWKKAQQTIRSDVPAHAWPMVSPSIHRAVIRFLLACPS